MLLVLVGLLGLATIGGRLATDLHGAAADADFFRSNLVTTLVAVMLTWLAASRGPTRARRPWRWLALAFTVLLVSLIAASVSAVLNGGPPSAAANLAVLICRLVRL